jgi:hypothetical protein
MLGSRRSPDLCAHKAHVGNNNRQENFAVTATTEQNKAIIRRFFDAWNSRQPDVFDDLMASNVIRHCEATPGVEVRRLDQVKEFLRQDSRFSLTLSKPLNF